MKVTQAWFASDEVLKDTYMSTARMYWKEKHALR